MTSLEIHEFKNLLINDINAFDCPMEVKRMVVSEVLEQIKQESTREIRTEFNLRKTQQIQNGVESHEQSTSDN